VTKYLSENCIDHFTTVWLLEYRKLALKIVYFCSHNRQVKHFPSYRSAVIKKNKCNISQPHTQPDFTIPTQTTCRRFKIKKNSNFMGTPCA